MNDQTNIFIDEDQDIWRRSPTDPSAVEYDYRQAGGREDWRPYKWGSLGHVLAPNGRQVKVSAAVCSSAALTTLVGPPPWLVVTEQQPYLVCKRHGCSWQLPPGTLIEIVERWAYLYTNIGYYWYEEARALLPDGKMITLEASCPRMSNKGQPSITCNDDNQRRRPFTRKSMFELASEPLERNNAWAVLRQT